MYFMFDLDDTILTRDKRITEFTHNVLKKLKDNGHKIIINSARTYENCKMYKDDMLVDYYITDGGAAIYDSEKKLIFKDIVSKEDVHSLITKIKKDGIADLPSVQTFEYLYSEDQKYLDKIKFGKYMDLTDLEVDATKIILRCKDLKYIEQLAEEYRLEFTNYMNGEWSRVGKSNKKEGFIALKKALNDPDFYCYAFGDDLGDIDMLQAADVGVALINSQPKVLDEISIHTTYSNNEDGCAKYIEDNILF